MECQRRINSNKVGMVIIKSLGNLGRLQCLQQIANKAFDKLLLSFPNRKNKFFSSSVLTVANIICSVN